MKQLILSLFLYPVFGFKTENLSAQTLGEMVAMIDAQIAKDSSVSRILSNKTIMWPSDKLAMHWDSVKIKPTTVTGFGIADFNSTARGLLSSGTGISYNSSTGVITNSAPTVSRSFNNTPSVTIQTVAAAANGDQLSTTRDVLATYSATLVSTATIAGNASGYLVLEICSTNSVVAANWIEIGRIPNGQAVSLAVVLQSVSTGGGNVTGIIPAGYYRRLRSVITAGSPTFTYNSGQETSL